MNCVNRGAVRTVRNDAPGVTIHDSISRNVRFCWLGFSTLQKNLSYRRYLLQSCAMHPSDRTSDALAPALAPAPTSSGIATRSPSAHESTQCSRTRRPRCYLSMRSVTHATVSCLCAKAYLVGVSRVKYAALHIAVY